MYWTLSVPALIAVLLNTLCVLVEMRNEKTKKKKLLHHRNRTTKKHVNRYMGITAMWKVTDNQIILGFGSTIKQPAEPHGEHEKGKIGPVWPSHAHPQRLVWQLLTSCAAITGR